MVICIIGFYSLSFLSFGWFYIGKCSFIYEYVYRKFYLVYMVYFGIFMNWGFIYFFWEIGVIYCLMIGVGGFVILLDLFIFGI